MSHDTATTAILPTRKPRRQLLQIRYHHDRLYNPDFISNLHRLSGIHGLSTTPVSKHQDKAVREHNSRLKADNALLSTSETSSRKNFIIRQGLQLERYLLNQLRSVEDHLLLARQDLSASLQTQIEAIEKTIDDHADNVATTNTAWSQELFQQKVRIEDEILSLNQDLIPGVEEVLTSQIFGVNLSRGDDGYLDLPADLALIGSRSTGVISSKIAKLEINHRNLHDFALPV